MNDWADFFIYITVMKASALTQLALSLRAMKIFLSERYIP